MIMMTGDAHVCISDGGWCLEQEAAGIYMKQINKADNYRAKGQGLVDVLGQHASKLTTV
jgi:hypothetical protein